MPTQKRPDEMVGILSSDLQPRYEPNFAWKSAIATFLAIPGLRGFWPMTSISSAGNAFDVSGNGRTMTYNAGGGGPTYIYDRLIPYFQGDGLGYLSRADEAGLDIIGTETYVGSSARGLTVGGWWYFDNAVGSDEYMISKWAAAASRSWVLRRNSATGAIEFFVSTDGTNIAATATGDIPADTTWFFGVGRYDPSTDVQVWVNDDITTSAVGVPATIFNSGSSVNICSSGVPGSLMTGRAAFVFLTTMQLRDWVVSALFQQTRALFNV